MRILADRGFTLILSRKFPRKFDKISGKLLGRNKKKVLPLSVAAETMPLELAVTSRPRPGPSTGLVPAVECIFQKICSTWFEAESGFRIRIWTRQYRQIVQNFDARLMEIALGTRQYRQHV